MSTTQETGQHLVVFIAAGDGSDAACEAVARKLAEKFGAPYERMLSSVRQSPRVFKRNLNRDQAESYATLLRNLGAVAEVQVNGVEKNTDAGASTSDAAKSQEASSPGKPPPPEATDQTCPFCGRALQAGGICVICKPREVGPDSGIETAKSSSEALPEPQPAPGSAPMTEVQPSRVKAGPSMEAAPPLETSLPVGAGPPAESEMPIEPAVDPNPLPAIQTGEPTGDLPVTEAELDTGFGFLDPTPPGANGAIPADGGWAVTASSDGGMGIGPGASEEPCCANCCGRLNQDNQCPVCDLGTPEDDATLDSASIENDLSTLLSPEELGVCPNCCGPMEQDGTCLICPPADSAAATGSPPPDSFDGAAEIAFPAPGEWSTGDPAEFQAPSLEAAAPETPEQAEGEALSPFEPLTPLGAGAPDEGADVCRGCGGPRGTDGTCLICGADSTGGAATPGTGEVPEFEEMAVTGNEPPPAEPMEAAAGSAEEFPDQENEPIVPPAKSREEAPRAVKRPGINLDLTNRPRALVIPLLAMVLLLIGGFSMAMADSFLIASGVFFLALIAGLVAVLNAVRHFERTMDRFPKLPKPVIIAFLAFVFFAGSGSIIGYALKQSALFLLEKASDELQAEADSLGRKEGLTPGEGETGDESGLSTAVSSGRIILEEEILERAIKAEAEGEQNPKTALECWSAYLEGYPDGERASEAKRKVSHWRAVVQREDALTAAITRDRKGNNDPTARIRDWRGFLATYGNTPSIRSHAEERIAFWESMLQQSRSPNFPYWASLRLDDGRMFSGKIVAENDMEVKMELPNRLKMSFRKGEYTVIDSDHINGKRVECENMRLVSGVTTERPKWGFEDGVTILGEDRAGVETTVSFRVTGFYKFEVMARASKDLGGFPSVILSLNGEQQERIRFDSEEWKLYKVSFPFRIPAGEQRMEIVFPPQYQTMQDKRIVAIDYFTTAMVE